MMKFMIILSLSLLILCQNQSITVTKSQICDCEEILNEVECNYKFGCEWIILTSIQNDQQKSNKCTIKYQIPLKSYCNSIMLQIECASSIGCAFYNNICQIFTGCSAYVKVTNKDCQLISNQCTTNNLHCIDIRQCQFYETQLQCEKNIASSGAKSCKWVDSKCIDKQCTDYPYKQPNQQQCFNWIQYCYSNGQECVAQLQNCNKNNYLECDGWIGIDGICIQDIQQQVCGPKQCIDAPTSLKTDQECQQFLSGCITMGQGCVNQLLSCATYKKQQGCDVLIGNDGYCTDNQLSESQNCRAKICEEAPSSLNTNQLCSQFQLNCITNGQGCLLELQKCSSYHGNLEKCQNYIGSDGDCYGLEIEQLCFVRECPHAPNTFSQNQQCDKFKKGCISNGYGCVSTLLACSQYQVDTNICDRLLGSDGKCFYDPSKTHGSNCNPKQCEDAPKSYRTNLQCQEYSFTCVTNGYGCISIQQCEITQQSQQCEGNNSCALINKCIDKRQCSNYLIQSECFLNKQNYQTSKGEIYERSCIWSNNKCINQQCNNYIGETDFKCQQLLNGCLTNGYKCIDKEADCTQYYGNYEQCMKFKGNNGLQQCTQLKQDTNYQALCIVQTCDIAKQIFNNIDSDEKCSQFMSGCFFDGLDNCTNSDCTTYYGTLLTCSQIKTAKLYGHYQQCQKMENFDFISQCSSNCVYNKQMNQCIDSLCLDYFEIYQEQNQLFSTFSQQCQYNSDMDKYTCCQPPQIKCSDYNVYGNDVQTNKQLCQKLYTNTTPSIQCDYDTIGTVCQDLTCKDNNQLCQQNKCENIKIPIDFTTNSQKQLYCQQFVDSQNINCGLDDSIYYCDSASYCTDYLAKGDNLQDKIQYCQSLKQQDSINCGYQSGSNCISCYQIMTPDDTNQNKQQFCSQQLINQQLICGYIPGQSNCSLKRSCNDFGLISSQICKNYLPKCEFNSFQNLCYEKLSECSDYIIPQIYNSFIMKAYYCQQQYALNKSQACIFDLQNQNICSQRSTCMVQIGPFVSDFQKSEYCGLIKSSSDSTCDYYIHKTVWYCMDQQLLCGDMQIYSKQLYYAQKQCQYSKDYQGLTCNYFFENVCTSPQYNCQDYKAYGDDIKTNKQLCQNLFSTSILIQCDYGTKGQFCQNFNYQEYIGTQNFCRTSSCQINMIPQSITNPILQGQFCQLYRTKLYANCYLKQGQNYCNDSYLCSDFVTHGNTFFDKLKYCQALRAQNQISCIYISGDNCISCSQIDVPQLKGSDELKTQYCSNITNSFVQYCGYQSSSYYCQDRKCDDQNLLTAPTCQNYMPQCSFNKFANLCYEKQLRCQLYKIPQKYSTTLQKAQYCSGQYIYDSKISCIYYQEFINNCSEPLYYDYCARGNIGGTQDSLEKSQYCRLLKTEYNQNCAFDGYQCISLSNCDKYQINSIFDAQLQCQNNLDSNGFNCNYKQGESTCQPPQQKCSDYYVYDNDVQTNKYLCQKLYTNTTPSIQCDYGTSGSVCQNLTCNTNQFCQQNKCENVKIPIDLITKQSKQLYCQQYVDSQNINCSLDDSIYYCDSASYCTDYLARGDNLQDKIQYCQSLKQQDSINCGYQSGSNCISCYQIMTPDDTNQNKQQFCSQQLINQQLICGYIPGQSNCSLKKSCNDFGLISSQICKNYLPKCEFNSFQNVCYLKLSECSDYIIPEIYNSQVMKAFYCKQQHALNQSLACIYKELESNICSSANNCELYLWPLFTQQQKKEYCKIATDSNNNNCDYDAPFVWYCTNQKSCEEYGTSSVFDPYKLGELYIQKLCQFSRNTQGFTCNYNGGETCSPPQQNCQNYKVYGDDIETNKQLCQNLFTNSIPSIQCDYGTEGQFCQNFNYQEYIGTQSFCKTSSCQINMIPQSINYTILQGQFCQLFRTKLYANCSLQQGQNRCYDSYLCSDFVTHGNNFFEKLKYCQALRAQNQISCIYISGDNCISCSQIDVPQQKGNDELKTQYCSNITNSFVQYCGYQSSSYYCQDRKCDDQNLLTAPTCQNYMPQCSFNKFANLCYEKQLRCQLYKIPSKYQTSLEKAKYCSQQYINGFQIPCVFNETMLTNCYDAQFCIRVDIGQISDHFQRSLYCRLLRTEQNQICAYDQANQCVYLSSCNQYHVANDQSLQSQLQCQNNLDSNGFNCNYNQGESNCQPPQIKCSDYNVYGNDIQTNKQLCQKLYTNTTPSIQCDYGTSGSVCQDLTCEDNQLCKQYNCENVKIPIDLITKQSKQLYCQQYVDSQNINCSLDDSIYYCDSASYCTDYLARGDNLQDKIQYCQSLKQQDSINCGYQSGSNCISCYQIMTPDDTNQNKQQFCSQQLINQQLICGYITGQTNCSLKTSCNDFGLISSQICKNYLPKCEFNSFQNACYEKLSECSDYIIPQIYNSYMMKALYCQQQYALNKSPACRFDKYYYSTYFCSNAGDCRTDIYPLVDHHLKAEYCSIINDFQNTICSYHAQDVFSCNSRIQCEQYGTLSIFDPIKLNQLYVQQLCQFGIDTQGFTCNYNGGETCSPPEQNCQNYKVYGDDRETNKQLCQNLFTNSSPSIQCDYGTEGQYCQNFNYQEYIGTQSFCRTSSCQINMIPQSITDPILQGQFCQLYRTKLYANCSLQQGQNQCSDSYLCSDFVTHGNNFFEKLKYCQALRASNQISCIYISGDNCISCSQIDVPQQKGNDELKTQYCSNITNSFVQYCGYQSSSYYCSDRKCDDPNLSTPQSCQNYMPQCSFNKFANLCYEKQLRCQLYKIPSKYSTTLQKAQYCSGQYIFGTFIRCVFNTDLPNNCNEPIITMHIVQIYDEVEKSLYCRLLRSEQNYIQAYDGVDYNCVYLSSCNQYKVSNDQSLQAQLQCQNNLDSNGFNCNYKQGESTCQPPQQKCSDYNVYGNDVQTNKQLCQKLYTNTTPSIQCDYDTFGSVCQNPMCKGNSCICEQMVISVNKAQCRYYLEECQYNGQGCVSQKQLCSQYQLFGPDENKYNICNNLVNSTGKKCTFDFELNQCIERQQCNQYQTSIEQQDKSNEFCQKLFDINNFQCVWKFGNTCSSNCYSALTNYNTDYLCNQYSKGCITNGHGCEEPFSVFCAQAPTNYKTDAQCKTIHKYCISNGFGCISVNNFRCQDIISLKTCKEYKNDFGCDLAISCKTKNIKCQDMANASECVNSPLIGQKNPNCVWDASIGQCSEIKCSLLPSTLTTHQGCNKYLSSCTTTGAGCVSIGSCSSYPKYACNNAQSTNPQKYCKWDKQECRPIICSDNQIAKTDFECNEYLTGCKTTGFGCSNNFLCSVFTQQQYCKQDFKNQPCIWYEGQCMNYQKCEDYYGKTNKQCQQLSNQCVTNGSNCIAITLCSKTILQISCIIGTNGICGWQFMQSQNQQCAVFSGCQDSFGKTSQQCSQWGIDCVTNGISCINKNQCQYYQNQIACSNEGLDGKCIWISQLQSCRLQQCEDNIISNHDDCYDLQLSTKCTTNGNSCIKIQQCQNYTSQISCNVGIDGLCIWDRSLCRLKQCEDYTFNKSDQCQSISNKNLQCVSDGKNCIKQQICSAYITQESCLGGGLDGRCAFNPNNTNVGKCVKFNTCSDADFDEITCKTREDSCYFNKTIINSTIVSQCQNHTCKTKQKGSVCSPIPSFDLKTYEICVLRGIQCLNDNPSILDSENCFNNSQGTYTWNPQNKKCTACKNQNDIQINKENDITISWIQQINVMIIILIL